MSTATFDSLLNCQGETAVSLQLFLSELRKRDDRIAALEKRLDALEATNSRETEHGLSWSDPQVFAATSACDEAETIVFDEGTGLSQESCEHPADCCVYDLPQGVASDRMDAATAVNRSSSNTSQGSGEMATVELNNFLSGESGMCHTWIPKRKQNMVSKTEQELKRERIQRQTRAIVNKLTPSNFDILCKELSNLDIDSEELVSDVTDVIHDENVGSFYYQPFYAEMMALFCKRVLAIRIAVSEEFGFHFLFKSS